MLNGYEFKIPEIAAVGLIVSPLKSIAARVVG
jgi:hypothetical protein